MGRQCQVVGGDEYLKGREVERNISQQEEAEEKGEKKTILHRILYREYPFLPCLRCTLVRHS